MKRMKLLRRWRDHRDGWNLVTFALDTEGGVELRAAIGGLPEE